MIPMKMVYSAKFLVVGWGVFFQGNGYLFSPLGNDATLCYSLAGLMVRSLIVDLFGANSYTAPWQRMKIRPR